MEKINFSNQIDAYLDGNLPPADRKQFEEALSSNEALEAELKQNILLREGLQAVHQEALRSKIRQWRSESAKEETPVISINRSRWIAVAASVLILLALSTFLWMPGRYADPVLAMNAYQDDESITSLERNTDAQDPLSTAAEAYSAKDFNRAAELFATFPDDNMALYGKAHSHYQLGDYNQAIQDFNQLLGKNDLDYNDRAKWYLLLSHLQVGKNQAKIEQLVNEIIQAGGFYQKGAEEIKRKRNSFWRSF